MVLKDLDYSGYESQEPLPPSTPLSGNQSKSSRDFTDERNREYLTFTI